MGLLMLAAVLLPQQIETPEFHTEKATGSFVVSAPDPMPPGELPVIVDFHGACSPSRLGANVTQARVWSGFALRVPVLVVGLNGRTRAWDMTRGEHDDVAYAMHVLDLVRNSHRVDDDRVYLAGFSSGADFLCKGRLQPGRSFAGSLVICPGPPNVVGLRDGELLRAKDHPFYFVTGEEDYIRKAGAWEAFLAIDGAGGRTMYREVPGLDHSFPDLDEYERLFGHLELLAAPEQVADDVELALGAIEREDFLLASTHLLRSKKREAKQLLASIRDKGEELVAEAGSIDGESELGRSYEAWWRLRTQFHRFPELAKTADLQLEALRKSADNRTLLRARRDWFKTRKQAPRRVMSTPAPGAPASRGGAPAASVAVPVSEPRVAAEAPSPTTGGEELWTFDRYLSYDDVTEHLRALAAEHPDRVQLSSMGRSIEGRELWVVAITDRTVAAPGDKPAAYIQGGIHGNEASSVTTALYCAWQMGANPDRRRAIDRLLRDVTLYVAPAVNPDALQHSATEPHTHWRPRFNYRPHDADSDGQFDEDPYEDLNGDGEIGQMYVEAEDGPFVLKDGKLVRGEGSPRYRHVGREGVDNDGDGRFSEDPPGGVNLNRNFPVGFAERRDFEGTRGTTPLSEPETKAITGFLRAHPVALFLDYHNAAGCVFYWLGEGSTAAEDDQELYSALAKRANDELGYTPRPLRHPGAGLSISWSYGQLGIPAAIVELEVGRGPEAKYLAEAWGGDAFIPARPFSHPQLGDILLGNDYRKIAKRNPHPRDIQWQAGRNWDWVRNELKLLPRLQLDNPRAVRTDDGFVVTGGVTVLGELPLNTGRARRLGIASPIRLAAEGAELVGAEELTVPPHGNSAAFLVTLRDPADSVTLIVSHPRGGVVRLPVIQPRRPGIAIRRDYEILPGYRTTADAVRADNEHFRRGLASEERGPVFPLANDKDSLRVAVLLGEWKERRHTVPAGSFAASMFSDGDYREAATGQPAYGSVRDFYREMSYGAFTIDGRVFDWVELPGTFDEYRKASFGASMLRDRLEAAVLARDGEDALDGFDGIVYVWAGNPVHRVSNLWPMRLNLKHRPGVVAFKMGEFYRGQTAPIGVACHELGHTFGVNDKYGLGAPEQPMGPWCLMCRGTHGAGDSNRSRPFHLCAWCKMVIGWVRPVVIDPSTPQELALRPITYGPDECYRVLLKPDGSEYLLLENRRREGFFAELPSAGLVVLKVGPNTRPSAPQKQVQMLPAHGLPSPSRANVARPEAVAWPQPGRTEVVVDGVRLGGIRLVDDVVYFTVGR